MQNPQTMPGKTKAFILVRDAEGKPKIDDPHNIPKPIWDMLTPAEQQEQENRK